MLEFTPKDRFEKADGRVEFTGRCPNWLVGKDRDDSFPAGQDVSINGEVWRIVGVHRHMPSSPYRSWEDIGLVVRCGAP
jgi:hypothetical protein